MRGSIVRALSWFLFVATSCVVGGALGAMGLAMAYPGVKGPNITEDELIGAFLAGAIVGGLVPIMLWRRRARASAVARARGER